MGGAISLQVPRPSTALNAPQQPVPHQAPPLTLTLLSSLAVASRRPPGAKAQHRTAAVCALSTVERPSAVGRHSRTLAQQSGAGQQHWIEQESLSTQQGAPCRMEAAPHLAALRTVLSLEAEATRLWVASYTTELTASPCPM